MFKSEGPECLAQLFRACVFCMQFYHNWREKQVIILCIILTFYEFTNTILASEKYSHMWSHTACAQISMTAGPYIILNPLKRVKTIMCSQWIVLVISCCLGSVTETQMFLLIARDTDIIFHGLQIRKNVFNWTIQIIMDLDPYWSCIVILRDRKSTRLNSSHWPIAYGGVGV